MGTIVVGIIVFLLILLALRKIIKDKREGKFCCGSDCIKCNNKCKKQK